MLDFDNELVYNKYIERRKEVTIMKIIGSIFFYLFIAFLVFMIGALVCSLVTTGVVETYEIEAIITDKSIVDEYKQPREYLIFWVDGEEAGELEVGSNTYARYAVGDLIPIKVIVKENCFGTTLNFYEYGG